MKKIVGLVLLFLIFCCTSYTQDNPTLYIKNNRVSLSESNSSFAIMYEQMANPGDISYVSQNFEAIYDSFDCQGADDFIIQTSQWPWAISSIEVLGIYYNGTGPAASVNVWFYKDSLGHPGAAVDSVMNVIPIGGLASGNFIIPIQYPYIYLYQGTYWISVQCNMDVASGGEWGWTEQLQANLESNWRNPLGNFLTPCEAWGYRDSECHLGLASFYHDFSFRINGAILPVEIISFEAKSDYSLVRLFWATASETNNKGFEIERLYLSTKNRWETVGFIPGYGTTAEPKFYSFIDKSLQPGKYQYRLKQIDFDGTFEYSKIIDAGVQALYELSLEQNYPNPFNPATKIKYTIPYAAIGNISLSIYDVLGNKIAVLINKEHESGEYEIEFDASNYRSGIYFYRLQTGEFIQTRKMVLMK